MLLGATEVVVYVHVVRSCLKRVKNRFSVDYIANMLHDHLWVNFAHIFFDKNVSEASFKKNNVKKSPASALVSIKGRC